MPYIRIPLQNILNVSRIVTLYSYDFSPNYRTKGEAHDFWEIVYVDSGELDLRGGEQVHHLVRGELIFHKPNEFHSVECDKIHSASVFIITFECRSPAMRFFYGKVMDVPKELRSMMKLLINECNRNFLVSSYPLQKIPDAPIGGLQLIRNYLECFLICLMRQEDPQKKTGDLFFTSQERLEGSLAQDMRQYLEQHVCERISLKEMSEHFHFGVSTLCNVFRKNTGKTIMHYFLELKINEAKHLLLEDNKTVSEISEHLGFETPQYFSRMFRRYVGISPRDFRSNLINRLNVNTLNV